MRPALSLALLLTGCVDPLDAACGGARPALASCTAHLYDADCGGTIGEPVFACDFGDCAGSPAPASRPATSSATARRRTVAATSRREERRGRSKATSA